MRQARLDSLPPSRKSPTYVLSTKEWLRFSVPNDNNYVKLVTNANVLAADYGLDGLSCVYEIRYRLVSSSGKVVKDASYVLRSQPAPLQDPQSGRRFPSHFYLGGRLVPLSSRTALIDLRSPSEAIDRVDVRLQSSDLAVKDVGVRLFSQARPPEYKLRYLWKRLPQAKKERLSRGNVYDVELMTREEKFNLLRNRWLALTPHGLEGIDFDTRRIYTVALQDASPTQEAIFPNGLSVYPSTCGVLKLPPTETCVRFEFYRAGEGRERRLGSARADLLYYPEPEADPVYLPLDLTETITRHADDFHGGYLEIHSDERLIVRMFSEENAEELEITPTPPSVPGYLLDEEHYVSFAIESGAVDYVPFRVDLRRFSQEEGRTDSVAVDYQLLDGAGKVLRHGTQEWIPRRAYYDRPLGRRWRDAVVSDVARFFFAIPPGCTRFRFTSQHGRVLVSAYTGLETGVRHAIIGGDEDKAASRVWFPVKPERFSELVRADKEVFVRVQPRPRLPNDAQSEREFHVRTLHPRDRVRALQALVPIEEDVAKDSAASRGRFFAVPTGGAVVADVPSVEDGGVLQPTLICCAPGIAEVPVQLLVNGEEVLSERMRGRTLEMPLPVLRRGRSTFSLTTTAGAQVYVDGVSLEAPSYRKATVYEATPRGTTFDVVKRSPLQSTLSVRVLFPEGRRLVATMRVIVEPVDRKDRRELERLGRGIGPTRSWTFAETRYVVRGSGGVRLPLLWSDRSDFVGGNRLYVVLGDDLPPGKYRVRFIHESGTPCFLSVVQGIPESSRAVRLRGEATVVEES